MSDSLDMSTVQDASHVEACDPTHRRLCGDQRLDAFRFDLDGDRVAAVTWNVLFAPVTRVGT